MLASVQAPARRRSSGRSRSGQKPGVSRLIKQVPVVLFLPIAFQRSRQPEPHTAGNLMITPATPLGPRIERRASESTSAQAIADAATARLARLQSITAALGNTVTQDAVAN